MCTNGKAPQWPYSSNVTDPRALGDSTVCSPSDTQGADSNSVAPKWLCTPLDLLYVGSKQQ